MAQAHDVACGKSTSWRTRPAPLTRSRAGARPAGQSTSPTCAVGGCLLARAHTRKQATGAVSSSRLAARRASVGGPQPAAAAAAQMSRRGACHASAAAAAGS